MGFVQSSGMAGTEGLANVLGVKKPDKAERPPSPQADRAEAEQEALKVQEERRKRLAAGGRASTIHTSRQGIFGQPTQQKRTLLGE